MYAWMCVRACRVGALLEGVLGRARPGLNRAAAGAHLDPLTGAATLPPSKRK